MIKYFKSSALLFSIILILLGYIIYLLGGFGTETTKVETTKIKFYFKEKPSTQYLDSLANYFEEEFDIKLKYFDTSDSLYYSKLNTNPSIIPVQKLTKKEDPCKEFGCRILYAQVVTNPMPKGKEYKKTIKLLRLEKLPPILKDNLFYLESITKITPI